MKNRFLRRAFALALTAACLLGCSALAHAEEPETSIRDWKGAAPAEGCWIDHTLYADAGAYDNPPTDVKIVRVGLDYDKDAVSAAHFTGELAGGFRIGYYDEDREFVEQLRTESRDVWVMVGDSDDDCLLVLDGNFRTLLSSGQRPHVAVEAVNGETYYSDIRYRGGFECRMTPNYRITVINCVDLENYVKGVIPYEMGSGWPLEALKAQAVCARTYAVYNQNQFEEFGFDITDDTESQVYRGTVAANDHTDEAVNATRGKLVRYKGEVCQIYYSAADGGATEDGRYVFGADHPYLLGKRDPFEDSEYFSYRHWTSTYNGVEIARALSKKGYRMNEIESMDPIYSAQGNVIAIRYTSISGEQMRLDGRESYAILFLPSARFTLEKKSGGAFVFSGTGLGHNCGMSQWGARAMDENYGYTYDEIIRFYFTGAYVA